MKLPRVSSVATVLGIVFVIFFIVIFFLAQSMVPGSNPSDASNTATSSLRGGTVTSSLAIGIGWKTYQNKLLGLKLQYPAELVIGRQIKPNTDRILYLWLPTGGSFGF